MATASEYDSRLSDFIRRAGQEYGWEQQRLGFDLQGRYPTGEGQYQRTTADYQVNLQRLRDRLTQDLSSQASNYAARGLGGRQARPTMGRQTTAKQRVVNASGSQQADLTTQWGRDTTDLQRRAAEIFARYQLSLLEQEKEAERQNAAMVQAGLQQSYGME